MDGYSITLSTIPVADLAPAIAPLEEHADDPCAAPFDPSTGLANRDWFRAQLALAITCARQEHRQVGLLFLDLSNLNALIGQLGPTVGSAIWKQVAPRVLGCLRASDTAGRIGENTLLVLLPEAAGEQGVSKMVVHLHRSLMASYCVDGSSISLTVNIGAAFYPNEGRLHDDLVKHSCMYLSRGHNRVSCNLLQRMALLPGLPPGKFLL